jgi:hypothetical protein
MKIIIGFLLLIIIVAIFKIQTPYKKIFMETLIETNKIKDFVNNLFTPTSVHITEHLDNKYTSSSQNTPTTTTSTTNKPAKEDDTLVNNIYHIYKHINTGDDNYLHKVIEALLLKVNDLLIKDNKYIKENPVYGENKNLSGDTHPHHYIDQVFNSQSKMLKTLQQNQIELISKIDNMDLHIYNKKKQKEKILKKYILKSSIPVCPQQQDMSKYVKKTNVKVNNTHKDTQWLGNISSST